MSPKIKEPCQFARNPRKMGQVLRRPRKNPLRGKIKSFFWTMERMFPKWYNPPMKITLIIPVIALSWLLQAELLDINPLIKIMTDAPVYAIFVWMFFAQQKQNDRLIGAIIQLSGKKHKETEDE